MKGATAALGLLVVVAAANATCPLAELVQQKVQVCKESTNASDETLELATNGEGDDNREVMCLQACLAAELDLEPKNLDINKVEAMLRMAENPDEDAIKTVMEIITKCKEEVQVSDDDCETAANFFKCIRNAKHGK